jgi:hypothetical protein
LEGGAGGVASGEAGDKVVRYNELLHFLQQLDLMVGSQLIRHLKYANMTGFRIKTSGNQTIRFNFYTECAPATCNAFAKLLPFTRTFLHARVSGQEIWTDSPPPIDVIQENASVFTEPGEVVFGPARPARTKTANCMGIYYGEGKGLDCCNIFAKVFDEDMDLLKALGDSIWKQGAEEITFELI